MKKILIMLMVFALAMGAFVGCTAKTEEATDKVEASVESTEEAAKETEETTSEEAEATPVEVKKIKVGLPLGSPAISMVKLMKEQPVIHEDYEVTYEALPAPDQLATMIINEEVDMIVVPTNLAAKLYNKGVNYQLASSNVWGTMYVVASEDIGSWDDLIGKELTSFGMGLTPDLLFNYLLNENLGDKKDQITINYVNAGSEVAPLIISGKTSIAVLPEPLVSVVMSKNENLRIVFDLQEEYAKVSEEDNLFPQASLLVNKDLTENHKEFVEKFLNEYEAASVWINENPMEAGAYYESLELGLPKGIVAKGLPRMNTTFVGSKDAMPGIIEYLSMLLEYSPDSIGGKLPDENFYFEK